jgi:photosystem II stability/assembly factor-like uncharacterized protein
MRVSQNKVVEKGTVFATGGLSITLVLTTMMFVWKFLFVIGLPAVAQSWVPVDSGTTANLRAVSAKGQVVWVSGDKGTVRKTTDGGMTWRDVAPRGTADVDFRDIEVVDDRTTFLMSSGQGPQSRIYKSTDGGAMWDLLTTNLEPKGFWDCMGFWDSTHGIILGAPVDGRFTIMTTGDGATWQKIKGPSANKDEGAFAASGTCVFTRGTREAWFGTGGVGGGRVFHSEDGGQTWSIAKTPIRHDSANDGIFSLAFSDALHGIVVGGDYMKPDESAGSLAITNDGGKTWTAGALPGYRSAVWCRDADVCVAVGTSGSDYSSDSGKSWKPFGMEGYNAISAFAVGTKGRIATLAHRAPQ